MITLDVIKDIMKHIEMYTGPMDMKSLLAYIPYPHTVCTEVIEFLQVVKAGPKLEQETALAPVPALVIDDTPLNLMDELSYNYRVAKAVLETSLVAGKTIDAEETRKSLRTISTFMEQALKLQERLYNAQQIQKFQDAVLDTLATIDVEARDAVLERLLESNL
jgi:hypothetical protein